MGHLIAKISFGTADMYIKCDMSNDTRNIEHKTRTGKLGNSDHETWRRERTVQHGTRNINHEFFGT